MKTTRTAPTFINLDGFVNVMKNPLESQRDMQLLICNFYVLDGIRKGKSAAQIAQFLRKNKSTISRLIAKFTREGYISRKPRTSYQPLELTPIGLKAFNILQRSRRVFESATSIPSNYKTEFRWHNLIFRIPILKNPLEIQKQLEERGFLYGRERIPRVRGWEMEIRGVPVYYNSKSFLIFPKPIYSGHHILAVKQGLELVQRIAQNLKSWFPLIEQGAKFELCRQHFAMKDPTWHYLSFENCNYRSHTLIVDCSEGVIEVEGIDRVRAADQIRRIAAFLDDLSMDKLVEMK